MCINVGNLSFQIKKKAILRGINFYLPKSRFLAVLGENGAGKTTLLDLMMGFKIPSLGNLTVFDADIRKDPWKNRFKISYLSEKVDIPGDWSGRDFLDFHSYFYPDYDTSFEKELLTTFKLDVTQRSGNLSAGELRRLQIVGALATQPELIIIDEITAVLDILGRITFLKTLKKLQQEKNVTVVLATNIPEGLERYVTDVLIINRGEQLKFSPLDRFLDSEKDLAEKVMEELSSC